MNEIIHPKWDETNGKITNIRGLPTSEPTPRFILVVKVGTRIFANYKGESVNLITTELLSESEFIAKITFFDKHGEHFEDLSLGQMVRIDRNEIAGTVS